MSSNNFTSKNQTDQLTNLRKELEDGWTVLVERVTSYFVYVFLKTDDEYKYLIYSYDVGTEHVYVECEKVGSAADFLFYFCNRVIER